MAELLKDIQPEPATTKIDSNATSAGSVFVSNYPPYSFWNKEDLHEAELALNTDPLPGAILGLYLHIPFCRKRCKFCYFRVYTDKNADEVETYIHALEREVEIYSQKQSIAGRPLEFVYFGGGTPSFISAKHLKQLAGKLKAAIPWNSAREITFECEPGTLTEAKLEAIRNIGVTRLSLGIENFDDRILEENGRAHHSKEIYRTIPWIRDLQFEQLNIDLIAGMLGETWDAWKDSVQKTIDLDPDSVTIYQMELPFNTVFTHELTHGGLKIPPADWETKRAWHEYAFQRLKESGYRLSSAYTMVKADKDCSFVYRDSVWHGCDMIGSGVASFSHMSGVHFQNVAGWNDYLNLLKEGRLPLDRAFSTSHTERLTREMILQLKMGTINPQYFRNKFQVDLLKEFGDIYRRLESEGWLIIEDSQIQLTPKGLLRADQLLPEFYDPKYRNARYT